jgi:hypothetical protein
MSIDLPPHCFRTPAMPRSPAQHPFGPESSGRCSPHYPTGSARESEYRAASSGNRSRGTLRQQPEGAHVNGMSTWISTVALFNSVEYSFREYGKRMYLPFVVTPFQLSLRARLCPIWLFPRAGKPQVAITTPANFRDDFDATGILPAIFSLLGSMWKRRIIWDEDENEEIRGEMARNMRVMYAEVYFSRRNVGRPRRLLRATFKKSSFTPIYWR